MIFLTIGTHEPFDRLIRVVDQWCKERGNGDEVLGQITDRATYHPTEFRAVASLSPSEYRKHCQNAHLIISHAGMGSIIAAMTYNVPIVVLPRRGHLHETRNDHQFGTAQKFGDRPGIFVALTENDLPQVLDLALTQKKRLVKDTKQNQLPAFADDRLLEALRDFIHKK